MALINPQESPFVDVFGNDDQLATEIFMAKLVHWLFNEYVLVLLKTSFYITECSDTRFHLKFYLREDWNSAFTKMRSRLLQEGALTPHHDSPQGKANACIRYVPKANYSLRCLLIRKKNKISTAELNMFKLLLHFIDARICQSRRTLLPDTIQKNWRNFLGNWKESGSPKLYYMRMDIRDAFPSVSVEKLKEILLKIGGDRERQQNVVHKQYAIICGTGTRKLYRSSLMDNYSRSNWHSGIHSRPCIVLDLNRDKPVNVWKMLDSINEVITSSNTVQIGKKLYEFRYGLPQGWGPSSILCSIYYGYIDSTLYIPYLETSGRLFLRVVDDYLFVTPVGNEILNLTQLIRIGCEKLGIKMNEEKFETNVFVRSDVPVPETSCECTTFCGWNFCFTCGHVSRDYTKYKGQDFCSTVTLAMIRRIRNPEEFIRKRGTLVMAARLKRILLDPSINCSKRILLTVYEASALLGFRFYALCRALYPTLTTINEPLRAMSLVDTIKNCCERLARLAKNNCSQTTSSYRVSCCDGNCCAEPAWKKQQNLPIKKGSHPQPNPCSSIAIYNPHSDPLNYDTILYTALRGFRSKLLNHSVVFKDQLLPRLNRHIAKLEAEIGSTKCETIIKIVGTKIPGCFQEISI